MVSNPSSVAYFRFKMPFESSNLQGAWLIFSDSLLKTGRNTCLLCQWTKTLRTHLCAMMRLAPVPGGAARIMRGGCTCAQRRAWHLVCRLILFPRQKTKPHDSIRICASIPFSPQAGDLGAGIEEDRARLVRRTGCLRKSFWGDGRLR